MAFEIPEVDETVARRVFDELLETITNFHTPEVYKNLIKAAALVRRGMTTEECRRASIELILEADAELPSAGDPVGGYLDGKWGDHDTEADSCNPTN